MKKTVTRKRRLRRAHRTRTVIGATGAKPRLSVFKSNQHIYAQVIDDVSGRTLAAASSKELKIGDTLKDAAAVGAKVAERAKAAGITAVVFDRGRFRFHGRVKALAGGAREAGMNF